MSSDRFHLIGAVYILLVRNGKVFLTRRKNTGWSDGSYSLVGGHLDGNETAREAATREAMEEAGVKVEIEDLEFVNASHLLTNNERIHFSFVTEKWEGEPHNNEPEKASEAEWFSLDALPKDLTENSLHTIECYKNGTTYSEFGWTKK